jgi:peptidyl-prolyl cis-trans isomerase A (cyclophilin A)
MANSGPNTNGSQFFINSNSDDQSNGLLTEYYPEKLIEAYKNGGNPFLDGFNATTPNGHTVFGQVIEGMDVVDQIQKVEKNGSDKPNEDIKINKIQVLQDFKK